MPAPRVGRHRAPPGLQVQAEDPSAFIEETVRVTVEMRVYSVVTIRDGSFTHSECRVLSIKEVILRWTRPLVKRAIFERPVIKITLTPGGIVSLL